MYPPVFHTDSELGLVTDQRRKHRAKCKSMTVALITIIGIIVISIVAGGVISSFHTEYVNGCCDVLGVVDLPGSSFSGCMVNDTVLQGSVRFSYPENNTQLFTVLSGCVSGNLTKITQRFIVEYSGRCRADFTTNTVLPMG